MSVLISYRKLLDLSAQMQVIAEKQDWDQLSELEAQRAALIARFPASFPSSHHLPSAESKAVAEIIRKIQICDTNIFAHILPAYEQMDILRKRLSPKAQSAA